MYYGKKTFVSITGPSGAGKSTLLMALSTACDSEIQIIKQTTTRDRRSDDLNEAFDFVSPSCFAKTSFLVLHGAYGVTSESFKNFLFSDKMVGVSVNGVHEVTQLHHKQLDVLGCNVFNVLVTYSSTLEEELRSAKREVFKLFAPKMAKKRLRATDQLCQGYFFNKSFRKAHIDLALTRESLPEEWANQLVNHFPQFQSKRSSLVSAIKNQVRLSMRIKPTNHMNP